MIVRELADSFLLIKQHDHALASGTFAGGWADPPRPRDPTLFAVTHHDVAWKGPDSGVRWNEEKERPYSFVDYPTEPKVEAYARGLDWLEGRDPYAACLCSAHYENLVRFYGKTEAEERFAEAEARRQARLQSGLSGEEIRNLDRNLGFLRLCDGLSLFVCLNEPGEADNPPPYPGGFAFDGDVFDPVWEDRRTLRLDPDPFSGPFGITIPYQKVGKDRRPVGGGVIEIDVSGGRTPPR